MRKILVIINYYAPYVSGVTECARIICEKLAAQGDSVTVLASNHDRLPSTEVINGVTVVRAPIIGKISKGTISPAFVWYAWRLAKQFDVVNLHLPMVESGLLSLLIPKKKLVPMFECDVSLSQKILDRFIVWVMDVSHRLCFRRSKCIMVSTYDYAQHSRVVKDFKGKTVEVLLPIKEIYPDTSWGKSEKQRIGFCGRIVEEKGVDVLIRAFHLLSQRREGIELLIAGDYQSVAGGSIYPTLTKYIQDNQIEGIQFLGKLPEEHLPAFYTALDVFVLPSINPLEAFGMVQVEAMRCGTPVVASDLCGVRTVVQTTGMGLVCKHGDVEDLMRCIEEVLDHREQYVKDVSFIESCYSTEKTVCRYCEALDQ